MRRKETISVEGVIFDLDGLLLDSEQAYFRCWRRAAEDLGYSVSEEQYAALVGIPNDRAERMIGALVGDGFPVDAFASRWRGYWEDLLREGAIPMKAGAGKLLDFLESRGVPKAIASSSLQNDVLASLGPLASRFPVIFSADRVSQGKPAPDLFLAAASGLGLPPASCLALEDSEVGVQAATSAGMPVILVPDMKPPSAETVAMAWRVCPSLSDVLSLLEDPASGLDLRSRHSQRGEPAPP